MKLILIALTLVILGWSEPSQARGGPDSRHFDHFATKRCASSSCLRKHPSGRYRFPYHEGRRK